MPRFRLTAFSRAHRFYCTSLAAAVLLPLSGELLAQETGSQASAAQSGPFINLQTLAPGARSTAEVGTQRLQQETGLSIRSLVPTTADGFKDLRVLVGKTHSRSLQPEDEMIVASRADGSFVALLPQANAIIRGTADGQQSLLRFDGPQRPAHAQDSLEAPGKEQPNLLESRSGQRSYQLDRSANGDILIDLLAGFSEASARFIGDPEAYALAQVVAVNRAVQQSQIQGVRLRLVGTQVVSDDMPITTGSLSQVSKVFADGIKQYSPDLVASFVRGVPGQDTAVGWAYVNGRYSINYINGPTVFRHELAHNIGGSHCSDGKSYRFGYNNGRVGTILCGNQVPYYSNPDLKDSRGVPLGDAQTANMARVWRENAAKISAYAPAVVPLADEQATPLLQQSVDLAKDEIRYFPLDVPSGTQRLVFSVTQGPQNESSSKVQLLLKQGSQPSVSDYDYRSLENNGVALAVNDPQAGRWYLALRVEKNKSVAGMVIEGHAFATQNETVKARYVRLVANSSVDGKEGASIAELHLADARGKSLPRGWRIHSASSTQAGSPGSNILDGNPKSYWASATGAGYPHQLVIDLGTESRFSQLHYLPRQDQGLSGNIKDYQVYGGAGPDGPWTLLADGEFSADNEVKSAALKPVDADLPPVAVINGKTEAEAGQQVVLDASASSDPQGNALSYAWEVTPALDFSFDGPRLSFSAPERASDTRYRFTLKLSNGKQSSSASHEVLVKAGGNAASCQAQWEADKVYTEKNQVQHKGRQYMARWWVQGSEPGNPNFTGADGSGKVWKDLGPCDNDTQVEPPLPSINGATQAKAGEQVRLDASGSSDPAGLPLEYRWSVTPSLSFQANGPQLTFIAPKTGKDANYRFSLELSNGHHTVVSEHNVKVSAEEGGQPSLCLGQWNANSAYLTGNKVSHNGHFYTARWWTQGNEPGNPAYTGGEGSGKVWRDEGACN
ncbi:chitinase [Pseudomonas sp. NFIX51]|uniref:discoidin domain-containing protein n=1 Tax=Pseudomonas TaxID=286 RepID=UPI0008D7E518|nr:MULTISPECIES: discoidin domain-containing protein [Pseudomonas]ROL86909.1 carbohydrate-binding family V/XII protein [Pseudomonas chlororaphis]SEM61979.1 chitinase [Pseudomonas sp. NFACC41-3]SMH62250.1 chitinase [Pseudomonas sp. NFIX51]